MTTGALVNIAAQHRWEWKPLWTVLQRSKEAGSPDLPPLSVFLDAGVVPRSSREDNHNQLGEDLSKYLVVRPGDIVFNKLRTWQGGLGASLYEGIVSPAYFVCRPNSATDARFVHYLLKSRPYLAELVRISKWMPPSQFDTPWENLRKLPLLLPGLGEQRRIADFLDAEIARIDRLVDLRRSMLDLLEKRDKAVRDSLVDRLVEGTGEIPLRRFSVVIEQGESPQCEAVSRDDAAEWAVLKLSSIKKGDFDPKENKRLPVDIAPTRGYEIRPGDLLVTRANTPKLVGDVAIASGECERLLLPDLIYRVRVGSGILPEFVAQVALSGRVRAAIESSARGTSQSMVKLRGEDIKSWLMPQATATQQRDLVRAVTQATDVSGRLRNLITDQISLLSDRRQALITAAVTGQLDVTTARPVRDRDL